MRNKVLLFVAGIAVWCILNTGLYAYFTNIYGLNPETISLWLGGLSLWSGLIWIGCLAVLNHRIRHAREQAAVGLALAVLGASLFGHTTLAQIGVFSISFGMFGAILVGRFEGTFTASECAALALSILGAIAPIRLWQFEPASDDLGSYLLPGGAAALVLVLAAMLAVRSNTMWLEKALEPGTRNTGVS